MSGAAASERYANGLRLLSEAHSSGDVARLEQSRTEIRAAIGHAPDEHRFHAVLGYALDWDETTAAEALVAMARARELAPQDRLVETYWLTLLAENAPADEVLPHLQEVARRQAVDLEDLGEQLRSAGLPDDPATLIRNAFVHARNHFASFIRSELERIGAEREPGARAARRRLQQQECREMQRRLRRSVRPDHIPEAFRALAPMARRYGIGDDGCRMQVLGRLSESARQSLVEAVDASAAAIHGWLEEFSPATMPEEASAFLYLLLAAEEIRVESMHRGARPADSSAG